MSLSYNNLRRYKKPLKPRIGFKVFKRWNNGLMSPYYHQLYTAYEIGKTYKDHTSGYIEVSGKKYRKGFHAYENIESLKGYHGSDYVFAKVLIGDIYATGYDSYCKSSGKAFVGRKLKILEIIEKRKNYESINCWWKP